MIIQDQPLGWIIELMRFRGPTVVSCKVVTGKKKPLVGAYLPPLHPGARTGLGGVPETILGLGAHSVRVPQRRCPISEPPQSSCC